MDHWSDNFTAEMVLKTIGLQGARAGNDRGGAAVTMRDLASAGIPVAGVHDRRRLRAVARRPRDGARAHRAAREDVERPGDARRSSGMPCRSQASDRARCATGSSTSRSTRCSAPRPGRPTSPRRSRDTSDGRFAFVGDRERPPGRLLGGAHRPRTGSPRRCSPSYELPAAPQVGLARAPARRAPPPSPTFEPGLSPTMTPVVFFETLSETLAPVASSAAFASSRVSPRACR